MSSGVLAIGHTGGPPHQWASGPSNDFNRPVCLYPPSLWSCHRDTLHVLPGRAQNRHATPTKIYFKKYIFLKIYLLLRKKKIRFWAHPILERRTEHGEFNRPVTGVALLLQAVFCQLVQDRGIILLIIRIINIDNGPWTTTTNTNNQRQWNTNNNNNNNKQSSCGVCLIILGVEKLWSGVLLFCISAMSWSYDVSWNEGFHWSNVYSRSFCARAEKSWDLVEPCLPVLSEGGTSCPTKDVEPSAQAGEWGLTYVWS